VAEIHRLLQAWGQSAARRALGLHWSQFRRKHQASAAQGHRLRRARQQPLAFPSVPEPLALLSLAELTPERWEQLRPFLPPQARTGRPAIEHRLMVEGILWIMRTGSSWRDLPARFGPWQTVASRYRQWRKEGRWQLMLQVLQPLEVPRLSSA
jgi:hypothetical protein